MTRANLPQPTREQLVEAVERGESDAQIAKTWGAARRTVADWRRQHGIARPRAERSSTLHVRLTASELARLKRRSTPGETYSAALRRLSGVTRD